MPLNPSISTTKNFETIQNILHQNINNGQNLYLFTITSFNIKKLQKKLNQSSIINPFIIIFEYNSQKYLLTNQFSSTVCTFESYFLQLFTNENILIEISTANINTIKGSLIDTYLGYDNLEKFEKNLPKTFLSCVKNRY